MPKVLVTGSTGFVGRNIVRTLLEDGFDVVVLIREGKPSERRKEALELFRELAEDYKGRLTRIEGSIFDKDDLARAMVGVDTVAHLVGIIAEHGKATFERIHVDGTKEVVKAAKKAGVRHILYMSALGASPQTDMRYHLTKYEAELIVQQSGLEWTIFRPSVILGKDDQLANLFVRLFKYAPIVPICPLLKRAKIQPVLIDDLTVCMLQSIAGNKRRQVHEIGGPRILSLADFLALVMEVSDVKRPMLTIPDFLFKAQSILLSKLLPSLPFGAEQLRMLDSENVCDRRQVEKDFGISLTPPKVALRAYLKPK